MIMTKLMKGAILSTLRDMAHQFKFDDVNRMIELNHRIHSNVRMLDAVSSTKFIF